ncbi:hypothetical protein NE237_004191 [Protea cynaroides]|uniref:Uncharacterized protein n=1 Tax=Protea cynaroides TaxID=273540 RepID=A0A9Q0KIB7_9MAGN|nr:hypothetical protein NE237_004191 [Protea cynaroides]
MNLNERETFRVLVQMGFVLTYSAQIPVIKEPLPSVPSGHLITNLQRYRDGCRIVVGYGLFLLISLRTVDGFGRNWPNAFTHVRFPELSPVNMSKLLRSNNSINRNPSSKVNRKNKFHHLELITRRCLCSWIRSYPVPATDCDGSDLKWNNGEEKIERARLLGEQFADFLRCSSSSPLKIFSTKISSSYFPTASSSSPNTGVDFEGKREEPQYFLAIALQDPIVPAAQHFGEAAIVTTHCSVNCSKQKGAYRGSVSRARDSAWLIAVKRLTVSRFIGAYVHQRKLNIPS